MMETKTKSWGKTVGKVLLFLCLIMSIAMLSIGCNTTNTGDGNEGDEVEVNFVEVVYRELMYINEEFDVDKIIEKESGVTYSIDELFYLESDGLTRVDIQHDGMLFTQTEPYDVICVVGAKKGKATGEAAIQLKLNYRADARLEYMRTCWNDQGYTKSFSADPKYLAPGQTTALKARYEGNMNTATSGPAWGAVYYNSSPEFSVEDWSNAVLKLSVFNDSEEDVQLVWTLKNSANGGHVTQDDSYICEKGKLTSIVISLRNHDVHSDLFGKDIQGGIYFRTRVPSKGVGAACLYTLYISDLDIVDYDAAVYPDLDTRTKEEIGNDLYESLQGEKVDKDVFCYTEHNSNYTVEFNNDKANTSNDESTSSLKYTYTKSVTHDVNHRSVLLRDMSGALFDTFGVSDWESVYLGFWGRTEETSVSVAVRFATTQDGSDYRGSTYFTYNAYEPAAARFALTEDWTYYQVHLTSVFGTHTEDVTNFKLALVSEISEFNSEAVENGATMSFYIDGLTIFSAKAPEAIDETIVKMSGSLKQTLVTDVKMDGQGSSVKYEASAAGTFYCLYQNQAVNLYNLYYSDIDWSKAHLKFSIKLADASKPRTTALTFGTTVGSETTGGTNNSTGVDPTNKIGVTMFNSTEWTELDIDLVSALNTLNPDKPLGVENVTGFTIMLYVKTDSAVTFWLDGFEIYEAEAQQQ